LLQKFCADYIQNPVEKGLFYRATPCSVLSYKHATLIASEKAAVRVAVLCCSNVSGTDKWTLLVIGKMANRRCFMWISIDSLPDLYYANKNVWITSDFLRNA
jgi:hypothetical protein